MSHTHDPDRCATSAAPSKSSTRPRVDLMQGWAGKTLAGTICGLAIALIASGLFMYPDFERNTVFDKYQIAMWIVPPIWLTVLSCCYLFRDAGRAWLWLGGISVAGLVLLKGLAA